MTFFELREAALSEAALSGAALSGAALSGAALSGAAAVVAEAEERQGEEEEDKRFAYRQRIVHRTNRVFTFSKGIIPFPGFLILTPYRPHHSTTGHQKTHSTDIRRIEVSRGR